MRVTNIAVLKKHLASKIQKYIRDNHNTQNSAAEELGLTKPRINNLINGKLDKFSVDYLIELLLKIDYYIDIKIME